MSLVLYINFLYNTVQRTWIRFHTTGQTSEYDTGGYNMRGRFANRAVLAILLICQLSVCLGKEALNVNNNSKYLDAVRTFADSFESEDTCTWSSSSEPRICPKVTIPLLVILLDFSDSDIEEILPSAENEWADLIFGINQAQGNHYWAEVSGGQFQLKPARETFRVINNGVVRVQILDERPTGTTRYVIENQTWIPDSLDLASVFVPFSDYDINGDGTISNTELSILFVLNINYQNIEGAGAQANISINHIVNSTGPVIEKFLRSQWDYTSIGVNMHELGHHILGLNHFAPPSYHGLMGMGAYAEDPTITLLHDPNSHWGTRPTHPTGHSKVQAGFVESPTMITETTLAVTLKSPHDPGYSIVTLPVVDGLLYIENRTANGYDRSIPFCGEDSGGLFFTQVSQYIQPLNIPGISLHRDALLLDYPPGGSVCDIYASKGHNDSFRIGGYLIENISTSGPVMTLDILREDQTPEIVVYKYRYFINDPEKPGYRLWRILAAEEGVTSLVDFSEMPFSDDASRSFAFKLDAYYNTGESRSVNLETTWSTSSSYLIIQKGAAFRNPGAFRDDALVNILFDSGAPYESSAIVEISVNGFNAAAEFVNLPAYP
jgi:M6 family metalloprotease-like protein